MTPEQQRALALARARMRAAQAEGAAPPMSEAQPAAPPVNALARTAGSLVNEIEGAVQGVSPLLAGEQGQVLGEPVQLDQGMGYRDAAGQIGLMDPQYHVVLVSPEGRPTVYARTPEMEASPRESGARMMGMGYIANPVSRVAGGYQRGGRLVDDFARTGVDPTLANVIDTRPASTLENWVRDLPVVGTGVEAARERQLEQLAQQVDRLRSAYGAARTAEEGGLAIEAGRRAAQSARAAEFSARYGDMQALIPDGAMVPLTETKRALLSVSKYENPKLGDIFQNDTVRGIYRAIESQGEMSWREMRQFRTDVRERLRADKALHRTIGEADIDRLYNAISADLYEGTRRVAGDAGERALRRLDADYAQAMERETRAFDRIYGTKSYEGGFEAMLSSARAKGSTADIQKLRDLRDLLPQQNFYELSAAVIDRLGTPSPSKDVAFDAATFLREYGKLSPEARRILFAGKNAELDRSWEALTNVIASVRRVGGMGNPSGTARMASAALAGLGLGAGAVSDPLTTGLAVGSGVLGVRAMTSPSFVRWLAAVPDVSRGGPRALGAHLHRLRVGINSGAVQLPEDLPDQIGEAWSGLLNGTS